MNQKKIIFYTLLLTVTAFIVGCNSEADDMPVFDGDKLLTVKTKATYGGISGANGGRMEANVTVNEFIASIGDIELEIDDADERSTTDSIYTDFELKGPFVVDLLADTIAEQLASLQIPVGIYDELEFKVVPNNNLDGKSLIINGEIEGTPFNFWTDEDEGFEINFPKNGGDLILADVGSVITINFDLNAIFGVGGAIDLTSAVDRNGDGVIDIYPGDPDGNEVIAYEILSQLEEATEIDEDEDLDEDGEGNDEDDDIDGDGIENDEDEDDDNDGKNDDEDEDDDNNGESDDEEDDDEDEENDDDQEDAAITAVLTVGEWKIASFTGSDGAYNEMVFTFGEKSIRVEDSTGVTEGEWEALTNTDEPMLLFEFEDASDLIDELDRAWKISTMEAARFELYKEISGEDIVVVFEKL